MSVVVTVAGTIAGGVVTNLIADAFKAIGQRLVLASPVGNRRAQAQHALHRALESEPVLDAPSIAALAAFVDATTTAKELQTILQDRTVAAVVQQLVCIHLVGASETRIAQTQSNFVMAARALVGSDFVRPEVWDSLLQAIYASIKESLADAKLASDSTGLIDVLAHTILIQATVESIETTLSSLHRLEEKASREEYESWLTKYRGQCRGVHGVITPPDFRERNTVPLDSIYVPGQLVPFGEEVARTDSTSLYEMVPTIDRHVILGDPGGGKSTATQAIAHHLSRPDATDVAYVVILRDYANRSQDMSIAQYIELQVLTRYQSEAPPGAIESSLVSGNATVLFDGLDELLNPSIRIDIALKLESFSAMYPAARMVVTSRRVGYKEAKLDPRVFHVYELAGYSPDNVREYVKKWFNLQPGSIDNLDGLMEAFLAESESISDLRSNPLLLALLCIIYRGQGYLPKNRVGIYEECSKLLFETWDRSRGIVFDFSFEAHIEDAMKHLAYWMFTTDNLDDGVLEPRLVAELTEFFEDRAFESGHQARQAARDFIEFCRGRAWVLSEAGTTPEGESLFKFTHRTFMEYFSASQITRLYPEPAKLARFLLPKMARNEWDTVGQLAIHISQRSADRGGEVALSQMLTSSTNRSVTYKDNTYSFVARCLAYLPVSPSLARKGVRMALDVVVKAASEGKEVLPSFSAWAVYASIENSLSETIRDEFDVWISESLASGIDVQLACALDIIDRLPMAYLFSRGGQHAAARSSELTKLGDDLLKANLDFIKESPAWVWFSDSLYFRGIISFEDHLDAVSEKGVASLDFLFAPRAMPYLSGPTVSLGWTLLNASVTYGMSSEEEASRSDSDEEGDSAGSAPKHRTAALYLNSLGWHLERTNQAPKSSLDHAGGVLPSYGLRPSEEWVGTMSRHLEPHGFGALILVAACFAEFGKTPENGADASSVLPVIDSVKRMAEAVRSAGRETASSSILEPCSPRIAEYLGKWGQGDLRFTSATV